MPKLYIDEDGRTSVYEILEAEVTIGRGAANAVQLRDPHASKLHALIRHERGRLKLVDLESRNGTRVNGAYRNQAWLGQGDSLTVGAAVLRLDLEGATLAPPPVVSAPAVPVVPVAPAVPMAPAAPPRPAVPAPPPPRPAPAARPAPPAARPAPPAARPAPTAAPRAPVRAAAPVRQASPRASASAPARGAGRRGREREEARYDDEDGGRPERKTGVDSSVIVLVGGIGAVILVVIMFLAMQSGLTHNKEVFLKADKMAGPPDNDYVAAIQYAEKNGDPGGEDWERLHESILNWKENVALAEARKLDEEATEYLRNNVTRKTRTRGFSPLHALPDDEIAVLLKEFLERYPNSTDAGRILGGGVGEPWETFQHILRQNASADADINAILSRAKTKADSLAGGKRYGAAIQIYESLEAAQRVLLQPDLYGTLVQETTERKKRLDLDAREDFSRDMAAARGLARRGEKRKARSHLQVMADTYGIPDLVTQAQDELIKLR